MVELNDDTRWILGRPNFQCGLVAHSLRFLGHEINGRAEDEQAHVIHWMLCLYEKHGSAWRAEANRQLNEASLKIDAAIKETERAGKT